MEQRAANSRLKKGASVLAQRERPLEPRTYTKRGDTMVAEKTNRQNGRPPFGRGQPPLSTVGRELARQGQRVRWNAQRRRAQIVNR